MKNTTKIIFLFLAFVLPVAIFVFLRTFGSNQFDVPPLYATERPPQISGCPSVVVLPYVVPDSVQSKYNISADSLTVVFYPPLSGESLNQLARVNEQVASDPVQVIQSDGEPESLTRCQLYLDSTMNVVMLDRRGAIRGQYQSADRDDMDRMLTEITIILKKY